MRIITIILLTIGLTLTLSSLNNSRSYGVSLTAIKNLLLKDIEDLSESYADLQEENNKLIRMMILKESLGELSNKIPMEELEFLLTKIPVGDVFRVPYRMTAGFGKSAGINGKYRDNHNGIDIVPIKYNWLITPLAEGFVEDFSVNSRLGKNITIRHNEWVKTVYAHNRTIYDRATTGKTVKANDAVAYLGSTGISDGIHLHLELWIKTSIGWIAIDPSPYLINLVKIA